MSYITTVQGKISPERLGFCQSHEHLYISKGYSESVYPDLCIDDVEKSAHELELYRQAGGCAITDAQPIGCGRDTDALKTMSEKSGIHIIASTGFHKMIFYPDGHWIFSLGSDRMTDIFISELDDGMYVNCDMAIPQERCGCCAGQVKTALDSGGFTAQYQKLFEAAAQAARQSRCALMVHIESGSDPLFLADFLYRQDVPLNRVIFCHMDRSIPDFDVHKEICERGITLEYDTVARPKYHDSEHECKLISDILSAGYEDQLLVSLDTTRSRLLSYGGGVGLAYIRKTFITLLMDKGISESHLQKIFVLNPAMLFSR